MDSILQFLNTNTGRFLIGAENFPIIFYTKNAFVQKLRGKYKAHIFSGDRITNLFSPIFTKYLIAKEYDKSIKFYDAFLHYGGFKNYNYLTVFLSTANISATSGSDGSNISNATSWANARDATNGTWSSDSLLRSVKTDPTTWQNARFFGFFDATTVVPPNATVIAINFQFPAVSNKNDGDTTSVNIISHTANNPLASGTYNNYGTTSFGTETFANISTSTTTNIALNASGLTAFVKNGNNKYGAVTNRDFANSAPTGNNGFNFTSISVKLIVTYELGGGAFFGIA